MDGFDIEIIQRELEYISQKVSFLQAYDWEHYNKKEDKHFIIETLRAMDIPYLIAGFECNTFDNNVIRDYFYRKRGM